MGSKIYFIVMKERKEGRRVRVRVFGGGGSGDVESVALNVVSIKRNKSGGVGWGGGEVGEG